MDQTRKQGTQPMLLPDCVIHTFRLRVKAKINQTPVRIHHAREGKPFFGIKMQLIEINFKEREFIEVAYENSVSYFCFLEGEGRVCACSFDKESPSCAFFKNVLRKESVVHSLEEISNEVAFLKLKLELHYGDVQEEVLVNFDKTVEIATKLGHFFGKAEEEADLQRIKWQKIISESQISSVINQVKTKHEPFLKKVEQKVKKADESLTRLLKPIHGMASSIKNRFVSFFGSSENIVVRSLRNFSRETERAINQGFQQQIMKFRGKREQISGVAGVTEGTAKEKQQFANQENTTPAVVLGINKPQQQYFLQESTSNEYEVSNPNERVSIQIEDSFSAIVVEEGQAQAPNDKSSQAN